MPGYWAPDSPVDNTIDPTEFVDISACIQLNGICQSHLPEGIPLSQQSVLSGTARQMAQSSDN